MRLIYEQVQKRLQTVNYDICTSMEKTSVTSWMKRFVQNAHIYGHQNGKSKPPIQALKRHFPQDFSWKLQQKIRLRLFCYKLLFFQCHWLSISHLDLRSFLGTTPILVLLCQKSLDIESKVQKFQFNAIHYFPLQLLIARSIMRHFRRISNTVLRCLLFIKYCEGFWGKWMFITLKFEIPLKVLINVESLFPTS